MDETEDSPMQDSSISNSDSEFTPQTPHRPTQRLSSELSPPDSQSRPAESSTLSNTAAKMPLSDSINSNGKRIWEHNGGNGANGKGKADPRSDTSLEVIVGKDSASGYQWTKDEDAPGYAWGNPKAREEASREFARFPDKDRMIKDKYGDVLGK